MADDPTPSQAPGPPERQNVVMLLNYLRWFAAEDDMHFNADTSLEWFCSTLPHRPLLGTLRERYEQVNGLDVQLFLFPHEKILVEKVLIPFHQAKVAFVLGHELGCIALCGMVAEMLATFRFQVSPHGTGPQAMTTAR